MSFTTENLPESILHFDVIYRLFETIYQKGHWDVTLEFIENLYASWRISSVIYHRLFRTWVCKK